MRKKEKIPRTEETIFELSGNKVWMFGVNVFESTERVGGEEGGGLRLQGNQKRRALERVQKALL